jgi:hypothetical protein
VLGIKLSASSQCTSPAHQFEEARTVSLGLLPVSREDADLVRENDGQTIAVAQR